MRSGAGRSTAGAVQVEVIERTLVAALPFPTEQQPGLSRSGLMELAFPVRMRVVAGRGESPEELHERAVRMPRDAQRDPTREALTSANSPTSRATEAPTAGHTATRTHAALGSPRL